MSRYFFVFSLFVFVLLTGCSTWITPSRMYKPERDAEFSSPEAILKIKEHIITIDDELIVYVYANAARDLINPEFALSSAGAPSTSVTGSDKTAQSTSPDLVLLPFPVKHFLKLKQCLLMNISHSSTIHLLF
jgi:hypothetical protein